MDNFYLKNITIKYKILTQVDRLLRAKIKFENYEIHSNSIRDVKRSGMLQSQFSLTKASTFQPVDKYVEIRLPRVSF